MCPETPDLKQGRALAFELECATQPRCRTLLLEHSTVPTLRPGAAFSCTHSKLMNEETESSTDSCKECGEARRAAQGSHERSCVGLVRAREQLACITARGECPSQSVFGVSIPRSEGRCPFTLLR